MQCVEQAALGTIAKVSIETIILAHTCTYTVLHIAYYTYKQTAVFERKWKEKLNICTFPFIIIIVVTNVYTHFYVITFLLVWLSL